MCQAQYEQQGAAHEWHTEQLREKYPQIAATWPGKEPVKTIASAFVTAKKAFGPALKEKNNPAFRSKYADLGACIDAVEDALLANGIAFIQETFEDDTGVTVETVFLHESGESMRCGKLHVPASKQDPQGYGSALTYARRYSLMAACGIAPEDDDGNAASGRQQKSLHHPVRQGIGDDLPQDWKVYLQGLAASCVALVSEGRAQAAWELIDKDKLEADQRVYLENQMDSKTRAAIKKVTPTTREAVPA